MIRIYSKRLLSPFVGLVQVAETARARALSLDGRNWALGEDYSVVDPYLLVFWIWSQRDDVRGHVADMPTWAAHADRVFGRDATWRCLNREGITTNNISDP